jgi:hypothetical protein
MWMNKFIGILIAINQKPPKDITEGILFFRLLNLLLCSQLPRSRSLIKPIANKIFYKPAIVECMDCWKSPSTAEISLLLFPLHLLTHTSNYIRNRHC